MTLKKYTISVTEPQYWQEVHDLLCEESSCEHVPNRQISCHDEKEHSPTRGTFILHASEAESLKNHPHVKWVELDPSEYSEEYPSPSLNEPLRWGSDIKVYRDLSSPYTPVSTGATVGELNRTVWSVVRAGIRTSGDFWPGTVGAIPPKQGNVYYTATGKHVDVVVHDSGVLASHPEFLDENGMSRVRDIVLDGPFYIDPDFFNARLDVYWNGPIINVSGDGSDFFKREVTVNGVRVMGAGTVGGQTAVPDAWLEKVARMFELFTDVNGAGINETFQRNLIKTLSGDAGTYHAGLPTIQRVARGAGADYSTNFLTDEGVVFWNLTNLFDTHVQNDMVWYLNSTGSGYGDGDLDAQEVIEHIFHTLHMHGLPAEDIKLYEFLTPDWADGDLYAAMEEAYDSGKWDPSGYEPSPGAFKTNADAYEVAAKEYLYLLNFCMFEYTELWEGGSLAPEWSDDMRTQAGIQANNPLGYAFHNTYIAPVISKPSLATIRSIFQDGNTPAQDDPTLAGASGYVVDNNGRTYTRWDGRVGCTTDAARAWWTISTSRSVGFSTIGLVSISTGYQALASIGVGSDGTSSLTSGHGTSAASLIAGKNFGLAFEANIWNMSGIGHPASLGGITIERNYDLIKLFHLYKPVNPETGVKNPTLVNGSWGYNAAIRSTDTVNYRFKGTTGSFIATDAAVANTVTAMVQGIYGASFAGAYKSWSSSSRSSSTDDAGSEMMDAGVIYVASAGNNNQYLGIGSTDPHRLNYLSDTYFVTTDPRPDFPTGTVPCNHRDWMNPQGIGFNSTTDPEFHPVICVGALEEFMLNGTEGFGSYGAEYQAAYSNNGPGIDIWSAADETLAAGLPSGSYADYQRYDDTRHYDNNFNGTSAAAPTASGIIAIYLQTNRQATSRDVKNWIRKHGSQYLGTELIASTGDIYDEITDIAWWTDYYNLRGAEPRIIFNPFVNDKNPKVDGVTFEGVGIKII